MKSRSTPRRCAQSSRARDVKTPHHDRPALPIVSPGRRSTSMRPTRCGPAPDRGHRSRLGVARRRSTRAYPCLASAFRRCSRALPTTSWTFAGSRRSKPPAATGSASSTEAVKAVSADQYRSRSATRASPWPPLSNSTSRPRAAASRSVSACQKPITGSSRLCRMRVGHLTPGILATLSKRSKGGAEVACVRETPRRTCSREPGRERRDARRDKPPAHRPKRSRKE